MVSASTKKSYLMYKKVFYKQKIISSFQRSLVPMTYRRFGLAESHLKLVWWTWALSNELIIGGKFWIYCLQIKVKHNIILADDVSAWKGDLFQLYTSH